MISLLHSEPRKRVPAPTSAPAPPPLQAVGEISEFEIVVGHRQMASVSLVVVVLLVVISSLSYLIGKSGAPKAAALPLVQLPAETPPVQAATPPAQVEPQPQYSEPLQTPLFADPNPGSVYIQVGAVEKGVAQIWVEGLRTHGLAAFVAPGPSDRIFRVLVGPLLNPDAYQHVKETLDRIGLATFGRKYQL